MKCSKAHKLISPYIDSELPEREVSALEGHMKVCAKCRTELEENKELHGFFASLDEFKAPYGFHTRVMSNISLGKTRGISRIPIFVRLAKGVVIIVVLALGVLSGSLLMKDYMPDKARDIIASLSLDVFDPAPPGSLGGTYLAMTEERNEK